MEKEIRGINILNPVDVDRDYYIRAVDFAIENGYNHAIKTVRKRL